MPGYKIERFPNISATEKSELTCGICLDVFRCPFVANCCRQTFCEECINEWLRTNNTCPYDRASLTVSQLTRPPRLVLNMLSKLQIKCEFCEIGCKEVVVLENINVHQLSCAYNPKNTQCFAENLNPSQDCVNSLLEVNEKLNSELQELKTENENLLKIIEDISNTATNTAFSSTSTISARDILRETRNHLAEPKITEIDMNDELKARIISLVGEVVREHNSLYIFCKTITDTLEREYGYNWHCIATYAQYGSCHYRYEPGFYIRLQYGKLLLSIYKNQFMLFNSLRQRFKSGQIKREISILNSDMSETMIADIKPFTYTALEKCETLFDVASDIRKQMTSKHGGTWQCFIYAYFGTFSLEHRIGKYVNYKIGELSIALYQASD